MSDREEILEAVRLISRITGIDVGKLLDFIDKNISK